MKVEDLKTGMRIKYDESDFVMTILYIGDFNFVYKNEHGAEQLTSLMNLPHYEPVREQVIDGS